MAGRIARRDGRITRRGLRTHPYARIYTRLYIYMGIRIYAHMYTRTMIHWAKCISRARKRRTRASESHGRGRGAVIYRPGTARHDDFGKMCDGRSDGQSLL